MTDNEDVNESDCCGNGCANCVLNIDIRTIKSVDLSGKVNILSKYSKFQLMSKNLHSSKVDDVWELHFKSRELPDDTHILVVNPGYHIMMRRPCDNDQENVDLDNAERNEFGETKRKYLLRPYSPYWCDMEEMEFKILVNLRPRGPMSDFIRHLQTDDDVEFRGPIGTFEYAPDSEGKQWLLIVSQGVAIAPAISIIEKIIHNDDDLTRILHLACFQNTARIYFREKLYDFQKYWNFNAHIYLAHESCDEQGCITNGRCLPTCKTFREKLKYKEIIHPFRLNEDEFDSAIEPLQNNEKNLIVVIAGTNNFQNYFKEHMVKRDYGFKNKSIYLL